MAYVFLSHSHADKPFVKRLAADLRNAGHSVWIDEAEIKIGDSLINKISAGLDQVDFVVAVLSETSVASEWVSRELEIASNREIKERRVVVLPLLVSDVALPGFLKGKRYGDFRIDEQYDAAFQELLVALGPTKATPSAGEAEIKLLREELKVVREHAKKEAGETRRAGEAAFQGKSDALKAAIEKANAKFPAHAPINRTYAFEMDGFPVTLDYALWAIAKSEREGTHVLAALLSVHDRWSDIENMMAAYQDMVERRAS
jgi:hypothetical protein